MDFAYRFPVVRGKQAGREYFIAMVPLKMLPRLFPSDDEYVLPEYRAQRKLNESRIPIISRYITENKDTYVFSALAASIDGEFEFHESKDAKGTGILEVSMDARFLINDGQHRKAAIIDAIEDDESLGNESISVVFFEDQGLSRSQQIFTDLNKHAVKTSNSISELYDSRDELAVLTRNVVSSIDFFDTYTDKEKDNLGKFSSNLFTLNTFYTANKYIVGHNSIDDCSSFILEYWNLIVQHMVQWQELERQEITKVDLRENYINTQNVVIHALGRVGHYIKENNISLEPTLKKLETINWRRSSKKWYMRAISKNGRIITNKKAVTLIANEIKKDLGLKLTSDEICAEESIQ